MFAPRQQQNIRSTPLPQSKAGTKSGRVAVQAHPLRRPAVVSKASQISTLSGIETQANVLNRAPAHRQTANRDLLRHLQRQYGNRYVNQVLNQAQQQRANSSQPTVQTKLTVGPTGDKYEREADLVASQVVQHINSPISPGNQAGQPQRIQRDEEKTASIQPKPSVSVIQREKMPGEEEDKPVQRKVEPGIVQLKGNLDEDEEKLVQKKGQAEQTPEQKREEEDKLLAKKAEVTNIERQKRQRHKEENRHLVEKKQEISNIQQTKLGNKDDEDELVQKSPDVAAHQKKAEEDDDLVQKQPAVQHSSTQGHATATPDLETAINQERGKGRPLPESTRTSMERAFGADFSGVRVHTDSHADQLNRSIQARAFTTGQNVFFRQGEFALGSKRGQELLAHELTHVVQQNGNAVQPKSLTQQDRGKVNKLQSKTKLNASAESATLSGQQAQGHSPYFVSAATSADASGRGDIQKQPSGTEAEIGEVQVQRQEAVGDVAPASPEADGAFQEVVSQAQVVGVKQKEHQPAEEKSKEAQAAAEPPSNEVESKAQDKQVEQMEQAPTPEFDAKAFKEALMRRIAEITPKTLEEADQFKNNNKLESVKNDVTGKVDEAQKDSQGPLEEKAKATPDTSGITPKPVTPLPPNQPGETPSINGAEKAAPKAKGQSEVEAPAQARSQSLDQQLSSADITEEQLAKSNEPQFQAALESKKTAQVHSETAPKSYRQAEQTQLSQAESTATSTALEKLQGMHGGRSQALGQVTGKQVEGKGKDEQSRKKIAGDIEKIYQDTKTKVDDKLRKLTTEVGTAFDTGAAEARKLFEDYVGQRMEAYKAERYTTTWDNPFGWANWIRDKLLGMPEEVNRFYEEGRDLYIKSMDGVIDKVVTIVGTGLTEAKKNVTDGKTQVKEYVAKLPEDLKQIGEEAAANIQSKFDGLEQDIQNKQDELIETLSQKYKENLDAVDARIRQMQEENKGLIQKAIDAIAGVIKTIVELAKMLLEVLKRVADVVGNILKDPIGFLSNLFNALKQGFLNFVKNIGKYLMQGLLNWLTGALAEANIQMPTSLDVQGILSLVTQVLGMTYDAIRARVVKKLGKDGEEKVSYLEKSFEMFRTLATKGVAGVWQAIKDRLGDIKKMVLDPIMQFLIENVIKAGVQWIIGLMTPASAFIKACKAIYDIVSFFIDRAQQIADLINSILDAIGLIANGAIDKAAQAVENSLAKTIPVALSFFASILGLGNISAKVQSIIQKLRKPIEKAIDWVIDQGVKAYKKVSNKLKKSKLGKKFNAAKKKAKQKLKAAKQWGKDKQKAVKHWFEKNKGTGKDKLERNNEREKNNKGERENQHKLMAENAKRRLEFIGTSAEATDYKILRAEAKKLAKWIEETETVKLEKGIKLRVYFEESVKDEIDGYLDFSVVIAPNDAIRRGRISPRTDNNKPYDRNPPRYHTAPVHGTPDRKGGTSMEVVLGPAAARPENYGSSTSDQSIPTLMEPLHDRDPGKWVAGHLLNDNLGGSGTDKKNLTPLTQTANKQHAGKEGKIKYACTRADQLARSKPKDSFWYGVSYKVVVSKETFGDFAPYNRAPSHIVISASLVKVNKLSKQQQLATSTDSYLREVNFNNIQIDNDDSHL